ncbi:MAG TPA: hypothetical protein DCS88_05590 [Alphaproteobacteria bacterium]|nr:hypothetical protein [Alphaproteobacteria bacterium]
MIRAIIERKVDRREGSGHQKKYNRNILFKLLSSAKHDPGISAVSLHFQCRVLVFDPPFFLSLSSKSYPFLRKKPALG